MKQLMLLSTVFLLSLPLFAFYETGDTLMGIYEGKWKRNRESGRITAQIRSLGDGNYDGFLLIKKDDAVIGGVKLQSKAPAESNRVSFTTSPLKGVPSTAPAVSGGGELIKKKFNGTLTTSEGEMRFGLKRTQKKSPTLGARAPKGAILVFDGKDYGKFRDFQWELVEGNAMQVKKGDLIAKDSFSNFELHLEFRTPYMPKKLGQARGNSGVYLQSIYEVQVLDSFGLYPLQINDCGSIYAIQSAPGNACLPPTEWQTYDIILRNGGEGQTPEITVIHNGVKTIDRAKVPERLVGKGGGGGTPSGGFLKLQDHGDPVQYRNIWVVPLK